MPSYVVTRAVRFRKQLFATGIPLSELVGRLAVVPPVHYLTNHYMRRSVLRTFESMNYLFPANQPPIEGIDEIDSPTFEHGNCIFLLYFAIGYYIRAHRHNQLTHTLQNVATANHLLRALPLLSSDRKEAIRNLSRALWLLRRDLDPICFNRPPDSDFRTDLPPKMRRLWAYLCDMDCMVRSLREGWI